MTATTTAPATSRGARAAQAFRRLPATVRADLRRWWLVAARPLSLKAWHRTIKPAEVPDDNLLLKGLLTGDNATSGNAFMALSIVLYLAAGALRWIGAHPLRRWSALLTAGAVVGWAVINHLI